MKKRYIFIILILVIYVLLQVIPYNKDKNDTVFIVEKGQPPLVIAHGGAKLLYPENTWMAYDSCFEIGVDVFEIDLRLTKDNVLITHHNADISDNSNGEGLINQMTLEQINTYNFAQNFTTIDNTQPYKDLDPQQLLEYGNKLSPVSLEEMFIKYGDSILYILEIKDESIIGEHANTELLRLIEKYELQNNVCVASFDQDTLNHFESISDESIVTSFDMSTATSFIIANYAGYGYFTNYTKDGFQLPLKEFGVPLNTKYLINKIHKNEMFVHFWTINDKDEMQQLINIGADGIVTDRPDLLIDLIKELNLK